MRFTSGVSDAVQAEQAVAHASASVLKQLGEDRCDLACLFASPIYRADWPEIIALVHERLHPSVLIGCSASGVIGADKELEWVPALSLVGASLPGVAYHPFVVHPDELEQSGPGGFWIDKVGASPEERPVFILLADAYTCDAGKLLTELNATYPHRPIVGGLVSGGHEPGEHLLFAGADVIREGAVGLAMTGNIELDTIVSQGCRPFGRSYVITKAEEHIVWELGGRPALDVLREALVGLSPSDQALAQQAIFAGVVINEMKVGFQPGDFVVRQLVGIDPPSGAIAVGEQMQVGQTIQFHLRDPEASQQDLRRLLEARGPAFQAAPPAGALFFNCTGRGKSFYGKAHQDTKTIRGFHATVPMGGFFCNGEIGPIGGTNWLHGYTASVGFFRPTRGAA